MSPSPGPAGPVLQLPSPPPQSDSLHELGMERKREEGRSERKETNGKGEERVGGGGEEGRKEGEVTMHARYATRSSRHCTQRTMTLTNHFH